MISLTDAGTMDQELLESEAEHRIRNLVWSVSGDYSLTVNPDVKLFLRSKERGISKAVSEGAFFRYFNKNEFSLYLMKKLYFDADERSLSRIVSVCMDAAVTQKIAQDHPGVWNIRKRAAEEILEQDFERYSRTHLGYFLLTYYGRVADGEARTVDAKSEKYLTWMRILSEEVCRHTTEEKMSPRPVIELVDHMYNHLVDPNFEKRHGDLAHVLDVTLEELAEADFNWEDFLKEEMASLQNDTSEASRESDHMQTEQSEKIRSNRVYELDDKARAKAYSYMELNYGRSYMKPLEQKRMNHALCRGVHEGCSLYFTDGILHNMVRRNYQSEYVRRQLEFNQIAYKRSEKLAARNIRQLADMMKQSLIRRSEKEWVRSDYGSIQTMELWKVGRTQESRLFRKEIVRDNSDFVVDILMDASGSQRDRRGSVAVQGYIISEALSIVGIPHRVQSFCTCWDYTILERFREYDDPREKNKKIFEFSTSANNRDGLAIKTVAHTLLQREEEHKILIILSDGRPNDRIVNRAVSRSPLLYVGDFAVYDTAEEVRRARNAGIAVLGVFAGEEEDLAAEKKIFGRDFAYIRNIQNFSHVVGRYLRRQLDVDL